MREIPADRRLIADADRGDAPERVGQGWTVGERVGRPLHGAVRRHRADPQAAVRHGRDAAELIDRAQPDHVPGPEEALTQEEHGRGPAGHEVRVLAVSVEQRERLSERPRLVVIERHAGPAARWIARTIP